MSSDETFMDLFMRTAQDPPTTEEKQPSAKKDKKAKIKRALKGGEETREAWWLPVVIIFTIIAGSFLILALTSSFMQFFRYNRVHTIESNHEEPRRDTDTRYTAAFVTSGPLTCVSMLFAGAVFAYVFSRSVDSFTRVGYLRWYELFAYIFLFLLSLFWLGWPGFWFQDAQIRSAANKIHSEGNEEFNWSIEGNIPYAIYWFTSPLGNYVRGINIYFLFASVAMLTILIFLFVSEKNAEQVEGGFLGENYRHFTVRRDDARTLLKWIVYILIIFTIWLLLGVLSHIILTIVSVFTNLFSQENEFWMMFNNQVHLSTTFFFAGWLFFFLISRGWWPYPANDPSEVTWSRVSAVISTIVGAFAITFLAFHLSAVFEDCTVDSFSPVEGDTELKAGVCRLIEDEKSANKGLHTWIWVNAIFGFLVPVVFLTATSLVSIFVKPDFDRGEYERAKEELNGNRKNRPSKKEKDSGSDPNIDSESFFNSYMQNTTTTSSVFEDM